MPEAAPRKLKTTKKRRRKLKTQINVTRAKIPSAWSIFKRSWRHIFDNKKLYLKLTVVYVIFTVILVKGFGSGIDLPAVKQALNEVFTGVTGQITTNLTLLGVLFNSVGSASSDIAALYQSVLLIIMSLAFIWAIRQRTAGTVVSAKEVFYNSMFPLVPFILVLTIIGLQLIPVIIAGGVNTVIFGTGLAATVIEAIFWIVLIVFLIGLSLYWLTASIFALYIVTLPGSTPLDAWRKAGELVAFRRWTIMRKLLFLPFALLLLTSVIMLPIILYVTPLAEWVFFVASMFGLLFVHTYVYTLYRDLL